MVEALPNLVAVRGGGAVTGQPVVSASQIGVVSGVFEAFRRDGWLFRLVGPTLFARAVPHTARVYRDHANDIVLSDGTIDIKFFDHVQPETARSRLEGAGFFIRQPLTVGRNAYRIRRGEAPELDIKGVVRKLESLADVEFVEPEWIEAFGAR